MALGIKTGKYRHYKGGVYEVLGICYLAGSAVKMVLYKALYDSPEFGNEALWVRPFDEFTSKVMVGGQEKSRFEYLG